MQRILIIGAYGLVGSNICKILECDYPNIEITKVKYDEFKNSGIFDYVIYAAGYGQPIKFSKDKLETLRIHSGVPLINAFNSLKIGGTFLYVSTSELYSGVPSPHKETDIGITNPQHPRACYIEGKRCGEAICMAQSENGYNVKIARLALAYGEGTKKGDTRVINQLIEQALTKHEIRLRDDGSAIRTYLYVEDAAKMILDILFKGKDIVYNVGGNSTCSIKQLAFKIADLIDINMDVILGNKSLEGSPSDVKLDITKIMSEFPRDLTNLDEGLLKTINYQKQLYGLN